MKKIISGTSFTDAKGFTSNAAFTCHLDNERVTGFLYFERDSPAETFLLTGFYLDLGSRRSSHYQDNLFISGGVLI